ncbi:DUF6630 family protein [Lysobacter arvi]|uniref:DUF6630 domain-containing protein n=1 Tax=Lysobacter arvi TaxID=3038776 RepID=A0ABU1CG83_9GAMM|nr:hypothetical protein [Lysobacter arvi]MDR0183957.1 hypothetical protein [Lysobacter arvi]
MHSEYDPDDNFARAFHDDADLDEDAAQEAVAWQFLLLVNPDDEDAAMEQFGRCREALADGDDAVQALREAIDWRAGFHVDESDAAGLIDVLDELAARFGLRIDWGFDADDDDALSEAEVPALVNVAFDRLREHHYTLWTYETGEPTQAGFITRQRDDEALRMVAGALGFHVRTGAL